MPRVTAAHQAIVRRRIIDAAVTVFAANGYRRATVADVVRESGLSVGAIYTYYSSKEALFLEACDQSSARGLDELAVRLEGVEGSARRLTVAVRLFIESIDVFDGAPGQAAMVGAWAEAEADPAVRAMLGRRRARLVAAAAALLEDGVERGELPAWLDVQAFAPALIAMLDGSILQRLEAGDDYRPVDALRQAQAVVDVLVAAAVAQPRDSTG